MTTGAKFDKRLESILSLEHNPEMHSSNSASAPYKNGATSSLIRLWK